MARIDREELRALIREALKEALAGAPPPPLRGRTREGGRNIEPRLSPTPDPSPQGGGKGSYRHMSGVLTEAKIAAVAKSHRRIVIGSEVAVTPLARDKARELKLEIVREAP
jgi:hypothetical protein